MKIAIVAGGSGGHIYPALTLAEGLRNRGHEITFFGSLDRMEKNVIPAAGFDYVGLNVITTRGSLIQKQRSLLSIGTAYRKCLTLLKGFDVAIGFGNYISIPVMLAAVRLKIKTIIHEQNSFAGRANRLLDERVDLIITSYAESMKQFRNKRILNLGNPQAQKAYNTPSDKNALLEMNLTNDKKTVLIFMGSLGSKSVNNVLMEYFKTLDGSYQVVYGCGDYNFEACRSVEVRPGLRIFEKVDGCRMMKNCDLLVSRAGATTLAEVSAIGIPSILIPSPYVPNNHQYHNAMALVSAGAAELLEEKDLNPENLRKMIETLLADSEKLTAMRNNCLALGNRHVLDDIIEQVEKI